MTGALKNKTVFITGATSGFGSAFAERFASEGARIIATGSVKNACKHCKGG